MGLGRHVRVIWAGGRVLSYFLADCGTVYEKARQNLRALCMSELSVVKGGRRADRDDYDCWLA